MFVGIVVSYQYTLFFAYSNTIIPSYLIFSTVCCIDTAEKKKKKGKRGVHNGAIAGGLVRPYPTLPLLYLMMIYDVPSTI